MEMIAIGVIVAYVVIKLWKTVFFFLMLGAVAFLIGLQFLT